MNIHTIARRAATNQSNATQLTVTAYFIKFYIVRIFAGLLTIGGFVIYMLAAITMTAIAQKVWGV